MKTLAGQIKRELETQPASVGYFANLVVRLNHVTSRVVNGHIVILVASAMHLSWAAALLFAPLHTTGVQLLLDLSFGSHIIAAILCAAVSLAAVAAIFCRNITLFVFLVLPQQFLLIASAIGAVYCVIDGKFADGAVYPRPFIFVDQIYLVLLCVAHGWQTVFLWHQREFA
ncbi:MAG: hypothetical protein J2P56_07980, partial [Verrucomicrobia bacterium]|nr:hypothetical protein [Verrucomicrobiota bacterium]